ncbi:hypothetical protein E2C01_011273 [Portunus trituberculatus]|uniref:Uncharacterized protein n=1 Tax=Portunus trituberculatus TaxID=210409 RepID=A0A5B7DAM6_PORTR|nr:hypothetical protein [Portunus trituberculatus]
MWHRIILRRLCISASGVLWRHLEEGRLSHEWCRKYSLTLNLLLCVCLAHHRKIHSLRRLEGKGVEAQQTPQDLRHPILMKPGLRVHSPWLAQLSQFTLVSWQEDGVPEEARRQH